MSSLRRSETLAKLYFRETGYTVFGSSVPPAAGEDPSTEENRERYLNWVSTRALTAALDRIADLEDAIARYA